MPQELACFECLFTIWLALHEAFYIIISTNHTVILYGGYVLILQVMKLKTQMASDLPKIIQVQLMNTDSLDLSVSKVHNLCPMLHGFTS